MAGIFGKLFNHLVQDVAVSKLANNAAFQRLAVRTVDSVQAAQKKLEAAAEDPNGAAKSMKEDVTGFWRTFAEHVKKDMMDAADSPPPSSGPKKKR